MSADHPLALFIDDEKGPMFREFSDDLNQARRRAQELADREGFPCILFSFQNVEQIGRFRPRVQRAASGAQQSCSTADPGRANQRS